MALHVTDLPAKVRFRADLSAEDHLRFAGEILATKYLDRGTQAYLVQYYDGSWAVWAGEYCKRFHGPDAEFQALAFYTIPIYDTEA
jgi:hypothetical protein